MLKIIGVGFGTFLEVRAGIINSGFTDLVKINGGQTRPPLTLVELEILEFAQEVLHHPVDVLLEGVHLPGPVVILQVLHHLAGIANKMIGYMC